MIEARDLEKRYGDVRAVKDVTFAVGRGEIVGLLGHNGAGKSTVMKMITGFLEPSGGTVTVGGKDVVDDRLAVQSQIGYLPESAPLYPEMLVQEYLLMMAELRGVSANELEPAVLSAAKSTGLLGRLVQPIGTLSKGYRQRVGLAQAILHRPEVLVLDEPTSGLDPVQIAEIRTLIKNLAADTTVILSTHILSEIEAVCDRVIILIDGVLAADSSMGELLAGGDVTVSLSGGQGGADSVLRGVAGVTSVEPAGADAARQGFELWTVRTEGSVAPNPAIVRACVEAGFEVGSIGNRSASLENVFRELIAQHGASAGEASA